MIDFSYRPQYEKIAAFHRSSAYERALFGGVGSGKTYALCGEAITFGLEQPGSRIVVGRKEASTLAQTTEQVFLELLPAELYGASTPRRANNHLRELILPNGTQYLFLELKDWQKFKSLNIAGLFIDEADEISEEIYQGWSQRLRQREPTKEGRQYGIDKISRRMICLASNPRGHNWMYRYFVDSSTRKEGSAYFTSTSLDNPTLPIHFVEEQLQKPVNYIRRYVMCQFDNFAGQVYPEWSHAVHLVPEPKNLKSFPIWMGMDPGIKDPTAAVWMVYDYENKRLVVVREYEKTDMNAQQHMENWRVIEKELGPISRRTADPYTNSRDRGSGLRLADIYGKGGFHFELGPVREDVRTTLLGNLIASGQLLCSERCERSFETIANAQWKDLTPQERELGLDSKEKVLRRDMHLPDAIQYGVSPVTSGFFPDKPVAPTVAAPGYPSYEEQMEAWHRERLEKLHRTIQKRSYNKSNYQEEAYY